MYSTIASKLGLETSVVDVEFSQPIALGDANTAQADVMLYELSATSVGVVMQQGNDLENWDDIAGTASDSINAIEWKLLSEVRVHAAYVRLKYSISGTGNNETAVLAAGITTSYQ